MNTEFLVCIENAGYEASLEKRKIYLRESDTSAAKRSLVRVVDESGETYLYPEGFFMPLSLPKDVETAVISAA